MKTYLGDSVYAEYSDHEIGDMITLTTENGDGPSNTIMLEPGVFENLIIFVNTIRAKYGADSIIIPKEKV